MCSDPWQMVSNKASLRRLCVKRASMNSCGAGHPITYSCTSQESLATKKGSMVPAIIAAARPMAHAERPSADTALPCPFMSSNTTQNTQPAVSIITAKLSRFLNDAAFPGVPFNLPIASTTVAFQAIKALAEVAIIKSKMTGKVTVCIVNVFGGACHARCGNIWALGWAAGSLFLRQCPPLGHSKS